MVGDGPSSEPKSLPFFSMRRLSPPCISSPKLRNGSTSELHTVKQVDGENLINFHLACRTCMPAGDRSSHLPTAQGRESNASRMEILKGQVISNIVQALSYRAS